LPKYMNQLGIKSLLLFIKSSLNRRPNLRRIVANIGWLSVDRILRMGVGLIVSVWVARYLGPEQYGAFNFAIAFVALFGAFASLGLDGIVIRNIVHEPERKYEILSSAFILKLSGGVVAFLICLVVIIFMRPAESQTQWLVGIIAAGMIFQSFDVIDLWFQSQVHSNYTVIAKNSAFFVLSLVKVVLILDNAPLIAFAWTYLAEIALGAAGLILFYGLKQSFKSWRPNINIARNLLTDCWPLILSGTAVLIYMKIDMVMLGGMVGDKAVGIYAAATRISEVWYFIPVIIYSSLYPSILKTKKISEELYYSRLQKLFDLMSGLSFVIAIPITFLSNVIINAFYKTSYAGAGTILAIHIWAVPFVFLGVAQTSWDLAENLTGLALKRALIGALTNILLNFVLIPRYSGVGAAVSTVVAYAVSGCLANVISKRTMPIFVCQLKSLFFVRYLFRTN
jgi:polysaccharide transporter, PST family